MQAEQVPSSATMLRNIPLTSRVVKRRRVPLDVSAKLAVALASLTVAKALAE